ncbi:MAG: PadR family transcriptional regulator [Nitrososphaerota archaeon]|nr:PadR family transcriptional regulator [Nitrososphaerota archaeon]
MEGRGTKKWIHPQAVPRGILRLYILTMLARRQETGYSIMRTIEDKTEGAWRPGPGTVYPLLRSLLKEGLLERAGTPQGGGTVKYAVTDRGKQELEEMQRTLASAGRRERVMVRLFADLLPAEAWASVFVNRGREIFDVFQEKLAQIPQQQREVMLKEARMMLESNLVWVESQLRSKKRVAAGE